MGLMMDYLMLRVMRRKVMKLAMKRMGIAHLGKMRVNSQMKEKKRTVNSQKEMKKVKD